MTDKKDKEKPEFTSQCCICGHALRPNEIGGNIEGEFIDYIVERTNGTVSIDFCEEHWRCLMEHSVGGEQRTAVARRRVAESLCKETKEKFWDAMSESAIKISEIDDILEEINDD